MKRFLLISILVGIGLVLGPVSANAFREPTIKDEIYSSKWRNDKVSGASRRVLYTKFEAIAAAAAPVDATYITQTANAKLTNEQALAALSTGIMRVATTTGAVTSLTDSSGVFANVSDETGGTGVMVGSVSPIITTDITVQGLTGVMSCINLSADAAEDNSDLWRLCVADGGSYTLETFQSGAWVATETMTNAGALSVTSFVSPWANVKTLAISGGDYTDASTAVAAMTANQTLLVFPGTYTDTITFAANGVTLVGMGKSQNIILTQADANVVDFNTRTSIQIRNMTISVTAANSDIDTITGSTGSFVAKFCNLQMVVSAEYDYVNLDQPAIANVTGAGTFRQRIGRFTYTHPGDSVATGIKAAFKGANGSMVQIDGVYQGTVTTSDGALVSTVIFDLGTTNITEIDNSVIDITDSTGEILTLDVAPATVWADGATITGASSGETCTIVDNITALTYQVNNRSGNFTLGEVLSDGTYTADQGLANPTTTGGDEASLVVGLGYLSGTATAHEYFNNTLHIAAGGSTAGTYGMFAADAGTSTTYTAFNHIHCTGAIANYSFFYGTGNTVTSHFDDIIAASGSAGTGTLNIVSSLSDGSLTASGDVTVGTALLTDGAGDADIGTEALYFRKGYFGTGLSFEGATDNDFQLTLALVDPTTPDKTITFPDETGSVLTSVSLASSLTSLGTIASLVATTADINAGTFDGVVGGTTPAAGSFVALDSSNVTDLNIPNMSAAAGGFEDSPLTTDGTDVSAAGAFDTAAIAFPYAKLKDSDGAGTDKTVAGIWGNLTATGDGVEVGDFFFGSIGGGTAGTEYFNGWYDSSDNAFITGLMTRATTPAAVAGVEAVKWDYDTATDNEVELSAFPGSGATQFHMNWEQIKMTGGTIYVPSSDNVIAAATGITAAMMVKKIVRVVGNTGDITITATPSLADMSDGQVVIFQGTDDTDTVTFQDEAQLGNSDLQLDAAADMTLGLGDTLTIMYDLGEDEWFELSRSNN